MNMNVKSLVALFNALHEHHVEYILVGGVAVILHDVPRVTEGVDVNVKRNPANVERLKEALLSVFDDESIQDLDGQDLEHYPVVRYGTPEQYYIDIMDRVGEMFQYDDLESEIITSHGIPIRVATIATLIKLKQGTVREIDKADVILLKAKLAGKT